MSGNVALVTNKGSWNALTNAPAISNSTQNNSAGDYYTTSVAGTSSFTSRGKGQYFAVGDIVVYNGAVWTKNDQFSAEAGFGTPSNWKDAYDNHITSGTFANNVITLNQRDGGSFTIDLIGVGGSSVLYRDSVTVLASGGQNAFTLSASIDSEDKTQVFIDGVYQQKTGYSVSGTSLTFDNNVVVPQGSTVEIISFSSVALTESLANAKIFVGDSNANAIARTVSGDATLANTGALTLNTSAKTTLGLNNLDNTSDANKPVSTATQTALDLKSNIASPTFTGTVGGITKAMVGLSNVDNTTDAGKPVSTATQSALDLKANLAGPTFTGNTSAANLTLTGYLNAPASFTIDPATHGDITGTVVIAGNLQVDGTQTTINSTTVSIDDLNLTLASGASSSSAANGAGITIDGASASMLYTHATTSFDFNKPINVTGAGTFSGNVTSGSSITLGASNGRVSATQGLFGTTFCLTSDGKATFGSTSSSVPIAFAIDGNGASPAVLIATNNNTTFSGNVSLADTKYIQLNNTSTDWQLRADNAGKFIVQTSGGSEFFKIRNNGEIAFGNGTAFNQFFNVRSSSTSQSLINIGTSDNSEFLNVGVVGSAGYVMMENAAALNIGTGGVTRLSISSGGVSTFTNGTSYELLQLKTSRTDANYGIELYHSDSTLYGYLGGTGSSVLTGANTGDLVIRGQGDVVFASGGNNRRLTIASGGVSTFQLSALTNPSGVDANTGIIVKNNGWSGITLLSSAATGSFLTFGDADAGFRGRIQYLHGSTDAMVFETAASEKLRITADYLIKRPASGGSGLYSKIKLVSGGSSNITHNIFREFKDSVNWTSGGVLVKVLSRSYNTSNFDYAEFLCRYGAYGGSTTAVDVKVAPHSSSNIPTPAYSSQSTISGSSVYRDVSIVTGYYRVLVIEIVTSMGQVYNSTAGGNGTIYYH